MSRVLVGESPQICRIRELIEQLGRKNSTVLLLGESGTGKEVVAQAIHHVTGVGEFVPIDCGALVGPLMESELFGHTKGAFTGAGEAKKGLIEKANGGTAFFDEIGDLPLDMQVKLLRLLQERQYRPVGSTVQKTAQFRVIAATHRDLKAEVAAGRFRQDLYYRLAVVKVKLPPLRERPHDIPLLVKHFLGSEPPFGAETLAALMQYDWPGNVRELQNCIEQLIATPGQLPSALQYHANMQSDLQNLAFAVSEVVPLVEVERRAITGALKHTGEDRDHAARLLGISRATLYRKLKEYKLD